MSDAVIRVFVFIILVVAHNYRSVIAKSVAAHNCKIVLKCTPAYGITSAFILSESIGTCINQVVDGPTTVMVLKTFVYRRNSYQCGSSQRHNKDFSQNNIFLAVRKSITHRLYHFTMITTIILNEEIQLINSTNH